MEKIPLEEYTKLSDAIIDLQKSYCHKLYLENKDGNMYSSELMITFINDLQKLIAED